MYTVVLMAAMTTGLETPEFGHRWRNRCHGCNGGACCGGPVGCCGGPVGCTGGCCGRPVACTGGCCGGPVGCPGGVAYVGGAPAGMAYGPGWNGATYATMPAGGYYSTMPNQGGYYIGGTQYAAPGGSAYYQTGPGNQVERDPAGPDTDRSTERSGRPGSERGTQDSERSGTQSSEGETRGAEPAKNRGTKVPEQTSFFKSAQSPAPATVEVTLPGDALLSFDGTPTRMTSTHRVFVSPPLQPGQT
jgi:hypothetical protein